MALHLIAFVVLQSQRLPESRYCTSSVDPDDNSIYTRRKINRLSPKDRGAESTNLNLAPLENTAVSDNSKNVAFPLNGWGTSLSQSPMFTRAEIEKHVKDSGKKYRNSEHHSLPTGLQKAKAIYFKYFLPVAAL